MARKVLVIPIWLHRCLFKLEMLILDLAFLAVSLRAVDTARHLAKTADKLFQWRWGKVDEA